MREKLDLAAINGKLKMLWGENITHLDEHDKCVSFAVQKSNESFHCIDCKSGTLQGFLELPDSLKTKDTRHSLYMDANALNMAIAHETSGTGCVHVMSGKLYLSDTRSIAGPDGIEDLCYLQIEEMHLIADNLQLSAGPIAS